MHKITNFASAWRSHIGHIVFFFAIVPLLSGCTIQSTAVLYNGTDKPIVVKLFRHTDEVLQIEIDPSTSEKLDDWLFYDIRISVGGMQYRYERADPGPEYVISTGFGPFVKRRVYLEFQSGGRVFVLKGPDQFGHEPPVQPVGFPLVGS